MSYIPPWLAVVLTLVFLALVIVQLIISDKDHRKKNSIDDTELKRRQAYFDPDAEPYGRDRRTQPNWPPRTPPPAA